MLITLPLYIMRELGKALGLALFIFSFLLVAFYIGQLAREGVTLLTVLSMLPLMLPLISHQVLPLTIVTGVLICYGRLSATNQFMAALASGIRPEWLIVPALTIALLASIITVFLNAGPLTRSVGVIERAVLSDRTVILEHQLQRPGSFVFRLQDGQDLAISRLPRRWDEKNRDGIDIIEYHTRRYRDAAPTADDLWDERYPYPKSRYLAKHHRIRLRENDEGKLFVHAACQDSLGMDLTDRASIPFGAGRSQHRWPLPDLDSPNDVITNDRLAFMGFDLLVEKLTEAKEMIMQTRVALRAAEYENPERVGWIERQLDDWQSSYNKRVAEIHLKLAMSFSCIFFAVFATPLALATRRQSTMMGFVIGIGLAAAYYLVTKAFHGAVRDGNLGWYMLWVPNGLLLLLGFCFWTYGQRTG